MDLAMKSMKTKKMGVAKSLVKKAGKGPTGVNPGLEHMSEMGLLKNKIPSSPRTLGSTKMKGL